MVGDKGMEALEAKLSPVVLTIWVVVRVTVLEADTEWLAESHNKETAKTVAERLAVVGRDLIANK